MTRRLPGFDRSQVAQHNDEAHGHWLIIDGFVYDVSELMRTHPGGARVLQLYAGRDATHGFQRVHHARGAIALPLAQARIGALRELECTSLPEHAAHWTAARVILDALALVVEMQNALTVDHAFQLSALHSRTEVSAPPRRSRYELQRGLETHARFQTEYLGVLIDGSLRALGVANLTQRCALARANALRQALQLLEHFDALADDELGVRVACFEVLDSWLLRAWKRELVRAARALERTHSPSLHDVPCVNGLCDRLSARLSEYFHHAETHGLHHEE